MNGSRGEVSRAADAGAHWCVHTPPARGRRANGGRAEAPRSVHWPARLINPRYCKALDIPFWQTRLPGVATFFNQIFSLFSWKKKKNATIPFSFRSHKYFLFPYPFPSPTLSLSSSLSLFLSFSILSFFRPALSWAISDFGSLRDQEAGMGLVNTAKALPECPDSATFLFFLSPSSPLPLSMAAKKAFVICSFWSLLPSCLFALLFII